MSNHGSIFLLVVIGLGFFAMAASADDVHASVMNRLGNGKNMTLHCQSNDDDLGQQVVAEGSEFGWDFSVNVVGTTLFFCDLGWGETVSEFHFDAYSFGRDFVRCETECLWIVAEEGVYGLNGQTGFWEYAYTWSNSRFQIKPNLFFKL